MSARRVKGIAGGIITAKAQSFVVERIEERKPDKSGRVLTKISPATVMSMAKDRAGGMTVSEISSKYSVSNTFIDDALKQLFIGNAVGREILKGVILDNAVAANMQAKAKMGELSPMQSVAAASVFTRNFIELDKHEKDTPKEIDVTKLNQMASTVDELMKELEGIE